MEEELGDDDEFGDAGEVESDDDEDWANTVSGRAAANAMILSLRIS